jgi:hypothetical protein
MSDDWFKLKITDGDTVYRRKEAITGFGRLPSGQCFVIIAEHTILVDHTIECLIGALAGDLPP